MRRRVARAEIFNPTCNTISLASYSVLFIPTLSAPTYGDGDWSSATVLPLMSTATLAVRQAATRAPAARPRRGASECLAPTRRGGGAPTTPRVHARTP